jgi:TPR repeat protein
MIHRNRIFFGIIFLVLTAFNNAIAGPFEDGQTAFRNNDYAKALQIWQVLADRGLIRAQDAIAFMYLKGFGVPQDYAQAILWYRRAASQGSASAQNFLGLQYDQGQGVPEDAKEAVKWYSRAAEQGHPNAQFNLATMYAQGRGVPKDLVEAHKWTNLAASRENNENFRTRYARDRDYLARRMTVEQLAEAQRRAREWKPKVDSNAASK